MLNKLEKSVILLKDYSLSSLDTFENEVLEELKNVKYKIVKIWCTDSN